MAVTTAPTGSTAGPALNSPSASAAPAPPQPVAPPVHYGFAHGVPVQAPFVPLQVPGAPVQAPSLFPAEILPLPTQPPGTAVKIRKCQELLEFKIRKGFSSNGEAAWTLVMLCFVVGSTVSIVVLCICLQIPFYVTLLCFGNIPLAYVIVDLWCFKETVTITEGRFTLVSDLLGWKDERSGSCSGISAVSLSHNDSGECVINEGAKRHCFGHRLTRAEKIWILTELGQRLGVPILGLPTVHVVV